MFLSLKYVDVSTFNTYINRLTRVVLYVINSNNNNNFKKIVTLFFTVRARNIKLLQINILFNKANCILHCLKKAQFKF